MDINTIIIVAVGAVIIFLLLKKKPTGESLMLQNQINELSRTVDSKLSDSNKTAQNMVREIVSELTKVGEGQKQIINVADRLLEIEDILKNPKQRGILGEYFLHQLLKNVMPPGSFELQYKFADGVIVDAAIFVRDKIIPVDSKFSLENYNRLAESHDPSERIRLEKVFVGDLKNRIVETAKYIRPNEGTTEFAFMFIPHEAIYYDLLVNKVGEVTEETENLIQRAASKYKVIIVSPTSFLAYLQTVLQGLKALQIEEQAQAIIQRVAILGQHVGSYEKYMNKLGASLGTTVSHYNTAHKELAKIDKDVIKISGGERMVEPLSLEKPVVGENLDDN